MHPEMTLVLLTVLAGAGQGIFILLVILSTLFYESSLIPSGYVYGAGIISLSLQMAGIIASTSHLGNPQRGWRAMLMVKISWLSREVITLSFSVGAAALYLLLFYWGIHGTPLIIVGLAGIAACLGFYISSSMVYASVTYIREWANIYTPINFTIFGITSGFGVSLSILIFAGADSSIIAGVNYIVIVLAILSLILKIMSYKFNVNAYVSVNIKNALGINDPDIKLQDMGTAYEHYNTKEYFYEISGSGSFTKMLAINISFVLPIVIWTAMALHISGSYVQIVSMIASIAIIVGLLIERRLFFIQGNNIQNLYYDNFRNTGAKNPLERRAKKGTPVPIN